MPFIPHTEDDTREMLAAIGADSLDDLFDEIPKGLLIESLDGVPDALNEMEISRLIRKPPNVAFTLSEAVNWT